MSVLGKMLSPVGSAPAQPLSKALDVWIHTLCCPLFFFAQEWLLWTAFWWFPGTTKYNWLHPIACRQVLLKIATGTVVVPPSV